MITPINLSRRNRHSLVDAFELKDLVLRGLPDMFDSDRQLFCSCLKREGNQIVRHGDSPRYTVITLLGLQQLKDAGEESPFEVNGILRLLLRYPEWVTNLRDLGLLIWLTALAEPDRLRKTYLDFNVERALKGYPGAEEGRTIELACFLAGLAHASLARSTDLPDVTDLVLEVFRRLQKNQGASGLFRHMTRKGVLGSVFQDRTGTFADQVYSIYALSRFAQAFQIYEPLVPALDCAGAICQLQGSMGQWWWRYDSEIGKITAQYPIYSVHQDALAPIALMALSEATGHSFAEPIAKGLRWIVGNNELHQDLRDIPLHVIWQGIELRDWHRQYPARTLSLLKTRDGTDRDGLTIREECRPCDFGWLLYALSNQLSVKSEPLGKRAS